jgi:hypothetical protein
MRHLFFRYRAICRTAALFAMFCASTAMAQTSWLTFVGNPGDAQSDLLEADPVSRTITPNGTTLNIRVSRALLRNSTDGIPFRSYTATVLVDCAAKTARFVTASFYMMPLWEGNPHRTLVYPSTEVRPLLLRFFDPNPLPRVIGATCGVASR